MKILKIYNNFQTDRLLKRINKQIHNTIKINDIVHIDDITKISSNMLFSPCLECSITVMIKLFIHNNQYETLYITHDKTLFNSTNEAKEYMRIHEILDERPYPVFKRIK